MFEFVFSCVVTRSAIDRSVCRHAERQADKHKSIIIQVNENVGGPP